MEPQAYQQIPPLQEGLKKEKSYMELKKEELRRYLAEKQTLEKNPQSIGTIPEPQDPTSVYEQQNREQLKQQMEYELAKEMQKMNQENQLPQDAQYDYGNYKAEAPDMMAYNDPPKYQDEALNQYQPQPFQPHNLPAEPMMNIPQTTEQPSLARKKSIGYNQSNIFGVDGKETPSPYTTESNSYGTGTTNGNALRDKIYTRKTPKTNAGFNIITGEFS